MESVTVADRFIAGFLMAAAIACLVTYATGCWIPPGLASAFRQPTVRIAADTFLSAVIALTRPLLFKTVLAAQRPFYVLDEDINAMLRGRMTGIVAGILVGAVISDAAV
jgi:hypothetical protein